MCNKDKDKKGVCIRIDPSEVKGGEVCVSVGDKQICIRVEEKKKGEKD